MIKKTAVVFATLTILSLISISRANASIPKMPSSVNIRVRIAEGVPKVTIRGFDLRIYGTETWGLKLVASVDKTSEWEFRCQDGKVRARLLHGAKNAQSLEIKEPVSIQTPAGFLSYGDQPYRDEMRIYSNGLLCEVINDVDLEKYLDGLVNSEFSSKWSEESVAAQVIAARTYGLYQIKEARSKKAHFDLNATTRDQVYNGSLKEDYRSSRVVAKTRGLILTADSKEKSRPIKAFYHSTCGGVTELPEEVWSKKYPGFKKRISCPYCVGSPRFQWSLELTTSEIVDVIEKGVKLDGLLPGWPKDAFSVIQQGKLLDIRITPLVGEARKSQVTTVWATGKRRVKLSIPAVRWRDWVGVTRIRSTALEVSHSGQEGAGRLWSFKGRGNGHGVGLCQWGAKVMGEKGFKSAAILKFYYPDAVLEKLW